MLPDTFGRSIRDLRISVTDRCNFKCFYCKSASLLEYRRRSELLTFEEIERVAALFVRLGVEKIRITGGEPLLRRGVVDLVRRLAALPGLRDLALTTNGFNLYRKAETLKRAGLGRVTISLDSLRPDRFREITRSNDFEAVLESISAARRVRLDPIRVNCVLVRGVNDDEILDFARFARQERLTVRFIEFMPLDEDEQWSREKMVSGEEILHVLATRYRLIPRLPVQASQTARNYDFPDGRGSIGLILPVSRPFCGHCSRLRLTADGKLRTCLFSLVEHDLRERLRSGASDRELTDYIRQVTLQKEKGHRINEPDFVAPSRSMSYIGG